MEINVGLTDLDMIDHIDHKWDMIVENDRVYLMCDCGDVITSCDMPHWYKAGETAQDDDIRQGLR